MVGEGTAVICVTWGWVISVVCTVASFLSVLTHDYRTVFCQSCLRLVICETGSVRQQNVAA